MGKNGKSGGANKIRDGTKKTEITEVFSPFSKKQKNDKPSNGNISGSGADSPERSKAGGRGYTPNAYQQEQNKKRQMEMGAHGSNALRLKESEMDTAEATGSNPGRNWDKNHRGLQSNHGNYWEQQGSQRNNHNERMNHWQQQGGQRNNHAGRMDHWQQQSGQRDRYFERMNHWQQEDGQRNDYSERVKSSDYSLGLYKDDLIFGASTTQSKDSKRSSTPDSNQRNGKNNVGKEKGVSGRDGDQLSGSIPQCPVCCHTYNLEKGTPKTLSCGHSVCSECLPKLIKKSSVVCPECRKVTNASDPGQIPINVALVRVISDLSKLPSIQQSSSKGSSDTRAKLQVSPHGSKCMEQGVQVAVHCVQCDQWICGECNRIDHTLSGCKTIPVKNALKATKNKTKADIAASDKVLSDMCTDKKRYERTLKTCLLVMRAAHEGIETTLASMQHVQDDSDKKLEELKKKESSLEESENVEECLLVARKAAEERSSLEKRSTNEFTKTRFQDEFQRSTRAMLNLTLHLNSNSSGKRVLAQLKTAAGIKYHKLVVDAGRVQVHAAEDISNVDQMRALPIEDLKVLVDFSSTLTFFDLSWGGKTQGRVYIRLTGDTSRGRQFQALCLGDRGPSFKNTRFHRIWWKGSPGEHIWGGDYTNGDGSGGTSLFVTNGENDPAVKPQPVTEGLVAGRYEQENFSSIFRIYTRSAPEAKEDAAFGRVEFGLDVVKSAINYSVVRDVVISDCGILIET